MRNGPREMVDQNIDRTTEKILFVIPDTPGGVNDFANSVAEKINEITEREAVSILPLPKSGELASAAFKDLENLLLSRMDWHSGSFSLLLHYSGYGFHKRGIPTYLPTWLEQIGSRFSSIGIFFHELYATGAPWRSSFWLSGTQKRIVRDLCGLSSYWITNREASANWLKGHGTSNPSFTRGAVLPISSALGELSEVPAEKERRIVNFGSKAVRSATYHAAGATFFEQAISHGYEIHDVGAELDFAELGLELIAPQFKVHGYVTKRRASQILSTASYGMLSYPSKHLAKSSILAAYCAHAVAPIIFASDHIAQDGLSEGVTHFDAKKFLSEPRDLAAIRRGAFQWYQPHNVLSHALKVSEFSRLLGIEEIERLKSEHC